VPKLSSIDGKYIFFFICIISIGLLIVLPPVSADNQDLGNNATDNSDFQLELNGSSYHAQYASEFNLSNTSAINSDIISTPVFLTSDFTGTESILSTVTFGSDQEVSAIWEDRVVWRSIFADPAIPDGYLSEIFLYNISTGEETKISSNLSTLAAPDIWEDLIVWSTWEDGSFEIYLYNISTNVTTRITDDSLNQINPRIWGDHIVWQEGTETDPGMAVYLYTISTGISLELDPGSGYAMSPAIWEDRVVWQDGRNGNDFDIYLYNITSGVETQISVDPAFQNKPDIWEDFVVWEDPRETFTHIYGYDINSGKETQVTFGEGDQFNPRIFEYYVVYVNQSAIFLTDLSSMNAYPVSSAGSDVVQLDPDIWDNRITWTDNRNGDYDIFLFTIGVELPPLLVDFTQNITQGEAPLTVEFIETSSGQADGWDWDFGDGNRSVAQNPVHTYSNPGSYTVSLTVHNPWQRNGVRRTDLISVGSVPVPQFSENQTSGPAPLMVQFNDESAGLPNAWKWEFGDGNTSNEQNPIYTYENAGVYDVSLTATNNYGNSTFTKQDLISVMKGTYQTCIPPSEGIRINTSGTSPVLELNTSLWGNCHFYAEANSELMLCRPEYESGIAGIIFTPIEGTGFSQSDTETISGPFSNVTITSVDIAPMNFSQEVGNNSRFNFSISLPNYPEKGVISVVAWEHATPEDLVEFNHICSDYGYVRVEDLAYSARFEQENISDSESAILIFGVGPEWVEQYGWRWSHEIDSEPQGAQVNVDSKFVGYTPLTIGEGLSPGNHTVTLFRSGFYPKTVIITIDDKRDSIHVIRIANDGSGDVLNTTFIGHDSERNLDFFRAESPNGLSTFGLASLSRSGNIFQIIQLTASKAVGPSGGGGGGGGGDDGGATSTKSTTTTSTTPVSTVTATAQPTAFPTQAPATTIETQASTATQPEVTAAPGETAVQPASGQQGSSPIGFLTTGTSSIIFLKNLSIVFVVIFVTIVFYYRWKRKEE
jgi:beta propeller repeat protein